MATNEEIKESIKLLDDQRKGLDKNSDQYKLLSRAISELNENLAISVDYLKQQKEQLELQKGTLEIIAQQTGITVDLRRKESEVKEAELATLIKLKEEQIKSTDNDDEKRKLQEELVKLLKDQTKEIEKQKDLTRAETQGKALANLLGISEANKNSLTYQIFSDPKSVFDGFKKEVDDAGGIVKAVSVSLLMKIQEASIAAFYAADKAYSGFAAATGASSAYNQVITATARGNTALGISFEESSRAVADLYSNLNTFSTLTQSTQEELTVTTAKLEKLGISGGDTAKSIQSLSITMGITELQAAKTVERFAAMGMAIGVSSKQMIYDFMSVKESLAAFGSAMDKTFTDLAAQAKATGVAVSELLTLANKFDTFEGAATQVGKLNAILGGPYLSAMAMIENTDPTSRIEMLRQAVSNANMSFESMTYYQKKAIAEAGGFKSVDEAQKILSMSAGEAAAELENQAKSQEELNKAIERAQPIQEKLTMIMANFAIVIEPLVTGVSELLTKIIKFQDENKEAATYVGYLIGGLVTLTLVITTLKFLFFGLSAVIGLFSTSSNTAGASGKIASVGIRSIGAAIVSVGKAASSPQVLAGLALVSAFLVAVGIAAFGMGYGLKMAAEGFASLIKEAVKAPEVFLTLGVAILALAAAITVLSLNPFVLVGMGVLLASFYGIADALNSIDTEKVINFKTVMEKSVEISAPNNVKGFEAFAEKFELVGKATNELNASNAQTFLNMINATQSLTQTLAVNQNITVKIGDKEINAIIDERIQVDKRKTNAAYNRAGGS